MSEIQLPGRFLKNPRKHKMKRKLLSTFALVALASAATVAQEDPIVITADSLSLVPSADGQGVQATITGASTTLDSTQLLITVTTELAEADGDIECRVGSVTITDQESNDSVYMGSPPVDPIPEPSE